MRNPETFCVLAVLKKHRTRIISGVHRETTLGPLPFNIYIYNVFYETDYLHIANYNNVCTPVTVSSQIQETLATLKIMGQWFQIITSNLILIMFT